jgi:hypothetical protein
LPAMVVAFEPTLVMYCTAATAQVNTSPAVLIASFPCVLCRPPVPSISAAATVCAAVVALQGLHCRT